MAESSETSSRAADTVRFTGGRSWAGTRRPVIPADGEGIIREANLGAFAMERFAVTVARFAFFAEQTGYVTDAERLGWSFVFRGLLEHVEDADLLGTADRTAWWLGVRGACWHRPTGRNGQEAPADHPVTHISWNDACAFARWAGGRLPTEIEWEHAARGGTADRRYPWGEAEPDDETVYCNIWQGRFPHRNTCADGYYGTAPVDAFEPNPSGLYNMAGNVWEWTADRYRVRSLKAAAKARNAAAARDGERVIKGGSFLCHASYCWRYRIAARSGRPADTSASHTGLRIAY